MSFSSDLKVELNTLKINDNTSAFLELFGMLKMRGSVLLQKINGENRSFFLLSTGNPTVARRAHYLIDDLPNHSVETKYRINPYLTNSRTYQLKIELNSIKNAIPELKGRDILSLNIFPYIKEDPVYFSDFLRGVFFVAGYIVDPKTAYHFEILEKDTRENILQIKKALNNNFRIKAGITEHKKGTKLYVKRSNDIIALMEIMGSGNLIKKYEQIVSQRMVKSNVNRSINFTIANAKKIGKSSAKQIEAIEKLMRQRNFEKIEPELKEICRLRLNNEDLSLAELGSLLSNPLSKSAVYNRMKRIIKLSKESEC